MRFDALTLFPDLFEPFVRFGVLGRAVAEGVIDIQTHDLRKWSGNRWGHIDDEPYGGGAGMVIQAPPVLEAVREIESCDPRHSTVVMMSPRGRVLDQALVYELLEARRLLLLCGRYEGFDERVVSALKPLEVSIGDFVLGGGEVAAMAVIEAVSRMEPGVVGDPDSVADDSFINGLLDYPCYTRPLEVEGLQVPPVLRSGHHEKVKRWRLERSVEATVTRRPDLVKKNWKQFPSAVKRLVRRYDPDLAEIVERNIDSEE